MRMNPWAASVAVLVALAAVVTLVVVLEGTPALGEDRLSRAIQDGGGRLHWLAVAVRWWTATEVAVVLGAGLVAWLALGGDRRRALVLAVALVVLPLALVGAKQAIDRERPTEEHVQVHSSGRSPSYPSGHAMGGTLLWGYVLLAGAPPRVRRAWWRLVRGAALAIIVLGPTSSVYLGAHWPTDVLGGLLLGGALAVGTVGVERRRARALEEAR